MVEALWVGGAPELPPARFVCGFCLDGGTACDVDAFAADNTPAGIEAMFDHARAAHGASTVPVVAES